MCWYSRNLALLRMNQFLVFDEQFYSDSGYTKTTIRICLESQMEGNDPYQCRSNHYYGVFRDL